MSNSRSRKGKPKDKKPLSPSPKVSSYHSSWMSPPEIKSSAARPSPKIPPLEEPISLSPSVRAAKLRPQDDDKIAIISDVHGDFKTLRAMLGAMGIIDDQGRRLPGWWVCQLGDLLHCGKDTATEDLRTLQGARDYFDLVLCGNHELWPLRRTDAGEFPGLRHSMSEEFWAEMNAYWEAGHWLAATSVGEDLITHAGLHPLHVLMTSEAMGIEVDEGWAYQASQWINEQWRLLPDHPLFGLRPFTNPAGVRIVRPSGLFRIEWSTLHSAWVQAVNNGFTAPKQIVGHTPRASGEPELDAKLGMWCNDVGAALSGRLSALVKDPGAKRWEPVIYERRGARRRSSLQISSGSYGSHGSVGSIQSSLWPPHLPETSATLPRDFAADQDELFAETANPSLRFPVCTVDEHSLAEIMAEADQGEMGELLEKLEMSNTDLMETALCAEDKLLSRYQGRRGYLLDWISPWVEEVLDNPGSAINDYDDWIEASNGSFPYVVLDITRAELEMIFKDIKRDDLSETLAVLSDESVYAIAWALGQRLTALDSEDFQDDLLKAIHETVTL